MSVPAAGTRASLPAPRAAFNATPHTADNAASRPELRRRGTTVIADRVFEKIAGQAASEVSRSRGRSGGVLGIGADADASALPKADVDLSADSVDVELAVGISYPGSIRAAAQQIRDHVSATVHGLTGVPVHRVDLDVTFLTTSFDTDDGPDSAGGSAGGVGSGRAQHRKQVLR